MGLLVTLRFILSFCAYATGPYPGTRPLHRPMALCERIFISSRKGGQGRGVTISGMKFVSTVSRNAHDFASGRSKILHYVGTCQS
jgi:hypothetical protein